MESSFIGEIRAFAFGFYPRGWLPCDGRTLLITQYQVLFAVISNIYGGNQKDMIFNLPDLRGRVPLGINQASIGTIGQKGGTETETLTITQIPAHRHNIKAVGVATAKASNLTDTPSPSVFLANNATTLPSFKNIAAYSNAAPTAGKILNPSSLTPVGSGLAHENRMPFLAMNYCICVEDGEFPVRGDN